MTQTYYICCINIVSCFTPSHYKQIIESRLFTGQYFLLYVNGCDVDVRLKVQCGVYAFKYQ